MRIAMRASPVFPLCLVVSATLSASQAHALDQPATLTPEKAVAYQRLSDLHFSPDASAIVCVVSQAKGPGIDSHIWLAEVAKQDLHQITFSAKTERSPQWSPAGDSLAFLSNRSGGMQIYVMPRNGGEARAVTSGAIGVTQYRWSPDGKQIAYLAREAGSEQDAAAPRVADREVDLERLWLVDVASGSLRQVTRGAWRIEEFDWTGAEKVLAIASNHPKVETWNNALYEIAMSDGSISSFSQPNQPFRGLRASPQRTMISYESTRNAGPIPHDLYIQNISGEAAYDASAKIDRAVREVRWQNERSVWVRVSDGFRSRIFRQELRGAATPIDLPYSVGAFDVAGDGTLVFAAVGFNKLPELYIRHPDGITAEMGQLQQGWEAIQLRDAEIFHVKSFDGTDIEAALMQPDLPPNNGKSPLVVLIHGGPASYFSAEYFWFNSWPQLLAARGYQVLMVNPRGSTGYGEKFVKANRGDLGGGDFKDVLAALDAVIARGKTDTGRLGIGGWSYGAQMTQWAIGHTNRFKAAVSGGGVFDEAAEFGTEDGAAEDLWYLGTPWENPAVFARNSPAAFIRNAKTPTLIVHGEADQNNPVGQSLALYRALKYFGVETELVIYPGEPHLPRQEKHQIDVLQRMLDWFDRYLK
jgi:dipeptidyl aminopeptidase/acylaminoacyl peptidase